MEPLAVPERIIAVLGALLVGVTTLVSLRIDWKSKGLDNQVFKIMLGLMAVGCLIVILTSVGLIGWGPREYH